MSPAEHTKARYRTQPARIRTDKYSTAEWPYPDLGFHSKRERYQQGQRPITVFPVPRYDPDDNPDHCTRIARNRQAFELQVLSVAARISIHRAATPAVNPTHKTPLRKAQPQAQARNAR